MENKNDRNNFVMFFYIHIFNRPLAEKYLRIICSSGYLVFYSILKVMGNNCFRCTFNSFLKFIEIYIHILFVLKFTPKLTDFFYNRTMFYIRTIRYKC